jgi:hypothetical protein
LGEAHLATARSDASRSVDCLGNEGGDTVLRCSRAPVGRPISGTRPAAAILRCGDKDVVAGEDNQMGVGAMIVGIIVGIWRSPN